MLAACQFRINTNDRLQHASMVTERTSNYMFARDKALQEAPQNGAEYRATYPDLCLYVEHSATIAIFGMPSLVPIDDGIDMPPLPMSERPADVHVPNKSVDADPGQDRGVILVPGHWVTTWHNEFLYLLEPLLESPQNRENIRNAYLMVEEVFAVLDRKPSHSTR